VTTCYFPLKTEVNWPPEWQTNLLFFIFFSFLQAASPRWEPQIAVLCEAGQIYQPQYLSEEGRWVTDLSKKTTGATCLRDKMDLLDYCKKVSVSLYSNPPPSIFFYILYLIELQGKSQREAAWKIAISIALCIWKSGSAAPCLVEIAHTPCGQGWVVVLDGGGENVILWPWLTLDWGSRMQPHQQSRKYWVTYKKKMHIYVHI